VQVEARRRGYFARSKFDQAKKTPFGPVLTLLSSLFKQVFSESDTNTSFHKTLKHYARPAWPILHQALGLPEFLLAPTVKQSSTDGHSSQLSQGYNRSLHAGFRNADASSSGSYRTLFNMTLDPQSSQDVLRPGLSPKSVRLINVFLDVLQVFTQHKFICFCLDDLQFADDESLDVVTQIISRRTNIVIILTYRPDEIPPERIAGIINPSNSEDVSLPMHAKYSN
jgi:predicted ATPase